MRKSVFKLLYVNQTRLYSTGQDTPKAVFDKATKRYYSITGRGAVTSPVLFTSVLVLWMREHRKQLILVAKVAKQIMDLYIEFRSIFSLRRSPNFNSEKFVPRSPKT